VGVEGEDLSGSHLGRGIEKEGNIFGKGKGRAGDFRIKENSRKGDKSRGYVRSKKGGDKGGCTLIRFFPKAFVIRGIKSKGRTFHHVYRGSGEGRSAGKGGYLT